MAASEPMLALQGKKYAICKKGAGHDGLCGYAHKTSDVDFPEKFNRRMWNCTAHVRKGHAGIDLFVGQEYTASQYDRILQMATAETICFTAVWARMFAWFNFLGDPNEYIADNDFGLYATLQLHSDMIYTGKGTYRFVPAEDRNGLTLDERMVRRLSNETEFPALCGVCDWHDDGGQYAAGTSMHWGAESRQYSPIHRGTTYYLAGTSFEGWLYVFRDLKTMLTEGGWCPPDACIRIPDRSLVGHEVTLPVFSAQSEPYVVDVPRLLDGRVLEVYTDGSHQPRITGEPGEGIAAGWVAGDDDATDRVSMNGFYSGAEISELLGIIGAAQHLWKRWTPEAEYDIILFRIDSKNAIDHVFELRDPALDTGRYLLPAIKLARALVDRFKKMNIPVYAKHVPSNLNCAHCIAKDEQSRRRKNDRWDTAQNVWPEFLPDVWKNVLRQVSINQRQGACIHEEIDTSCHNTI